MASYFIWRNLAATFEWEYVNVDSNFATNSYDRNVFTAGAPTSTEMSARLAREAGQGCARGMGAIE